MMPHSESAGILACTSCPKTFRRLEHLKRHVLIHTREKTYACQTCGKEFTSDALKRHDATHQSEPSLLHNRARACLSCAIAKDKCSGEVRCSRCRRRNLECTYPEGSRPDVTSADTALILDPDFWDPNILSTSNWLDGLGENGYGLGFLGTQYPTSYDPAPNLSNTTPSSSQPTTRHDGLAGFPGDARSVSSRALLSPAAVADAEPRLTEPGTFYVDGEPARRPRTKRRRTSAAQAYPPDPLRVFSLRCSLEAEEYPNGESITVNAYNHLAQRYQHLCLQPGALWQPYQDAEFPSKPLFDLAIRLYSQHFDQTLPLLHRSILAEPLDDIFLILPIVAIGCHYLDWPDTASFSASMLEFSRRLMQAVEESATADLLVEHSLHLGRLLNAVGMAYSGDDRLRSFATLRQHALTSIHSAACEQYRACLGSLIDDPDRWSSWIRQESLVRLAYAAWLIDCMWCYHFNTRPTLSLRDGALPVPCPDNMWQATSAQEWSEAEASQVSPIPLTRAVQQLYIDKKLLRTQGQFARILTIHGLFHHSWEIEGYFSNPLNAWEPTAKRQVSAEVLPKTPIWLPSTPIFAKWQNTACDALDILHWQANATIGQASGLEHPEVLHLHTARIVLLVPYKEILEYAKHLCVSATRRDVQVVAMVTPIQRWAVQHQFKARLAVIHSGVTFWHVRQYSADAFHEAHAVALATLTMWAYGKFASRRTASPNRTGGQNAEDRATNNADSGSDDSGSIILLDHPTDDELVQQFIRNGQRMRTHIEGVGDLLGARGPRRVLLQGCKLLTSLKCWGAASEWLRLLQQLADVESTETSRAQIASREKS